TDFETEAKSLDENYKRNPFGDFNASSENNASDENELGLPAENKKYINSISYEQKDCWYDDITGLEAQCRWIPGDITQKIKKQNYFLHWINRYKFSSLTKDYD
ncbi:hypothetical protein, partial [Metamycoplasma equirhinis]|uniref:hypothetical protein n=1 Tax=Metamycoplasma equirhinis TaxID=92402 RepID=UPI003592E92D